MVTRAGHLYLFSKKNLPIVFWCISIHIIQGRIEKNDFFGPKHFFWGWQIRMGPFISQKNLFLASWYSKWPAWDRGFKKRIGSWDIDQYMPQFLSPNQTLDFWDFLANILGPNAFSKPFFVLKPYTQAVCFECP